MSFLRSLFGGEDHDAFTHVDQAVVKPGARTTASSGGGAAKVVTKLSAAELAKMTRQELKNHPDYLSLINKLDARSWREVVDFIKNDEMFAEITDKNGFLPLHIAVRNGAPVFCLEALLLAYPVSITIADPDGNLPIHLACKFDKTCVNLNILEIFNLLANLYLDSLLITDRKGNIPLAVILKSHGPSNAILSCIVKDPRALEIADAKGNLPLHLAIQFDADDDVIRQILKYSPTSVSYKNNDMMLPIHKAAQFDVSDYVIERLLLEYPQGAFEHDSNGNLPLHLLYMNRASPPSENRLDHFIRANPTALSVRNNKGLIPIQNLYSYHDSIENYEG